MEYGLIGEHLGHSFSKEIHRRIGDYTYELKEIAKDDVDAFMKSKDFKAINVTIPYKQTVIPYLDEIDENAKEIGAVNCIVNSNGKLKGYNTDFDGMKMLILKNGIDLKNKKVLILGTGGTSKTAKAVVKSLGAKTILNVSRTASLETISYEEAIAKHKDANVIINTTPVGMFPNTDGCPIDILAFDKLEGVIDAIFNPLRSNLVMSSLKENIPSEGGLYMLVVQAIKASEHFFDKAIDDSLAKGIFDEIYKSKCNIVLTGMPGSGKSSVGKHIQLITGRELFDTDSLIVEKAGMEISDIFAKYGEQYFRDLESEVIDEVSKKNGVIISTGGGAVLRDENVQNLKRNGSVFFIDRALEDLIPTDDRPLANDVEKIKKLYETRFPIYEASADVKVKVKGDAKSVAEEIIKRLGK